MSNVLQVRERELVAHSDELHRQRVEAYAAGKKDERATLTRMIPRDDDHTVYPGGKLEHPEVVVAARFDLEHQLVSRKEFYERGPSSMAMRQHYEVFHLRPRQHALVLPDGGKVVWWSWELAR